MNDHAPPNTYATSSSDTSQRHPRSPATFWVSQTPATNLQILPSPTPRLEVRAKAVWGKTWTNWKDLRIPSMQRNETNVRRRSSGFPKIGRKPRTNLYKAIDNSKQEQSNVYPISSILPDQMGPFMMIYDPFKASSSPLIISRISSSRASACTVSWGKRKLSHCQKLVRHRDIINHNHWLSVGKAIVPNSTHIPRLWTSDSSTTSTT